MGTLILYLSGSTVCLFILSFLIKIFDQLWWTPIRIQSILRSQGIKGPSYRFFHGNSKEMIKMEHKALNTPMGLSHERLLSNVLPHVYSWGKIYGKNFLRWHGPQACLVIQEPDLIKEILHRDEEFYKIPPEDFVKKLLGDGIIITRGEKWSKLRKISNHAFHAESLKGMVSGMITSVDMMLERWNNHDGNEIEVYKEFKVLTSEIISRTAFGSSYLEGQEIFDKLIELAILINKHRHRIKIPAIRNLFKSRDDAESDKLEQIIHDTFRNMIKKREAAAMTGQLDDEFGSDFLGLLLKASHTNDKAKKISISELIDECKSFYLAGHETTTSLLTWIFFLLATNPDWQDKARAEVLQIFGHQNPSPAGLAQLKIVSMIINETLRLYPPVVDVFRSINKDLRLGKYFLPANIQTEIPILAIHHNSQIWGEDVYQFKPERFAGGAAKATNNNIAAYLPFVLGARNCVGSNFAITETKIALSMILQSYSLSLSPTYVHSPTTILTMCPLHGLQIILHKL